MSFKDYLQKAVRLYFVLVTLIMLAIFIIGTACDPDAKFGYSSFTAPLKYAFLGVLPTFVMISKKELSAARYIIRKAIQLVIVEAEIMFFLWDMAGGSIRVFLAVSVFVIFVLANVFTAVSDWFTARKLTSSLEEFQKNAGSEA